MKLNRKRKEITRRHQLLAFNIAIRQFWRMQHNLGIKSYKKLIYIMKEEIKIKTKNYTKIIFENELEHFEKVTPDQKKKILFFSNKELKEKFRKKYLV